MTKTAILVLQDTNTLSLAAAVDPLRAANRQSERKLYDWSFATPTNEDVQLTSGLTVPAAPLQRVVSCDLLILVAGFNVIPQATPALLSSIRRLTAPGTVLMTIDGGAWLAAKAGLLDGHAATTHWEDLAEFSASFPDITLQNARFVTSGNRWTSSGAAPTLDMMLQLIELQHGTSLSTRVAAGFIHTRAPSSTDPQIRHPDARRHSALTNKAHAIMEDALDTPIPIPTIAKKLGLSTRCLQLHFQQVLGITPKTHYLTLRLAEAHRLIKHTKTPLHSIALATGFGSQSSLARAHSEKYGASPRTTRTTCQFDPQF
ncbi:AraC family transcriptional regulator [Tateyamaria omphalii]|uniref:GlxA family transcriptional regulator n=1 Tax=Tateyamaria omphalii TaxID=299262 RepID=UPI0016776298|nr:helix-turn-helix domain-containing protein [Tateyamaria omphalii]GGX53278.1 AraC family transcriptional regulator [Tateyamaria omphalii]